MTSRKAPQYPNEDRDKVIRLLALIFGTGIHAVFLLTIIFDTLIPLWPLLGTYLAGTIILALVLRRKKGPSGPWLAYVIFPTACNLLLTLNYFISEPAGSETYRFYPDVENQAEGFVRFGTLRTAKRTTSYIFLEDNKYHEYPGMRLFSSVEQFYDATTITYHFHRGLLGFRVVKSTRFN